MTEQTTLAERSKLLDETILPYNAQKRLSLLGFEVAKMETSGWKVKPVGREPVGREGIMLSKTNKGEKGSIGTEIHAYEDQITVKKTARNLQGREEKRVEITQRYSKEGQPEAMSLSLITNPIDENNQIKTLISWAPPKEADIKEWRIDPGKCFYTKGTKSSIPMVQNFQIIRDSLSNWGFAEDSIDRGIPLEPENLLINTVRQSIKYPEDFFTPMVVLFSKLPQP